MGAVASCKATKEVCCTAATGSLPLEVDAVHPELPGSDGYAPQTESEEPADLPRADKHVASAQSDVVSLAMTRFMREMSPTSMLSTESSHFHLDPELLRGIPLKAALYGLGKIWRRSPVDLPDDAARASLWSRSTVTDELDIFLSHTWHTPGWKKVLALLVQSGSHCFLFGWLLGVTLVYLLELAGVFPPWWSFPRGHSMRLGGFLGSFVGLLTSPYMPWCCGGREMCFLDVVCINQADYELMQKGVYGLGGFLAASREMRILWSLPYLSRLWCVFELAAFRKANPTGRILLKPLFLEMGLLSVILAIYFFVIVEDIKVRFLGNRSYDMSWIPLVLTCCSLLPFLLLLHGLRRMCYEKRQMISALRTFDLAKVDCKVPGDKDFIYEGIRMWYRSPEGFEEYVRGPLADELTEPFFFLTLPLVYWAMAMTPVVSAEMDVWLPTLQQGLSADEAVAAFLVLVITAPLFCMNIMQLILFLCEHLSSKPAGFLEYCKTILVWLIMVLVVFFFVLLAGPYIQEARIPGGIIAATTNVIIFYVSFRCKKGHSD
mmetsp:Transcript_22502/g.53032  ORF Transcript_22502/g.53032 Transcript_22502/m.53032 type:complete len:547 (-) Transcript_22502:87-1727(-)